MPLDDDDRLPWLDVVGRRLASSPGLVMAWVLRDRFGEKFDLPLVAKMLHNDVAMKALTDAKDPDMIPAVWQADLAKFRAAREKYLLYN